MDVLYRYNGIDFIWDAKKAASNATKHGVRFERAPAKSSSTRSCFRSTRA